MNWIWDITLQAERDGFPREDLFFIPAENASPYYEQSFKELNKKNIDNPVIEINPLRRFNFIFEYILHPDILNLIFAEQRQFIYYFFDAVVHFLIEIDLAHGMTKQEFYIRQIRREMLGGVFGKVVADGMNTLDREKQLAAADEFFVVMQTGSNIQSFCRAMRQTFPGCFIYQKKNQPRTLYVYIEDEENETLQKRWLFVRDMFLPLDIDIKVFWKYHFGIMGVDSTMQANMIALF